VQQGLGQAKILIGRTRLDAALVDAALSPSQRGALRVLKDAQRFGIARLGLAGDDLYGTLYDTHGEPVAWNVSASHKDRFEARTWWFPIVGKVPYLGFFVRPEAEAEAERLRGEGLDVNLRGVGAYSTLGWFDDPVFTSGLGGDRFEVARLVLHEMAHATVFFAGEIGWNENFATLVGDQGVLEWLAARHGPDSAPVRAARRRLTAEAHFEAYMKSLVERLKSLYASDVSSEEKLARRERVFEEGKRGLAEVLRQHPEAGRERWLEREWNNAVLLSFSRYRAQQGALRKALDERFGGDLSAFVAHCASLNEPYRP